MFSGYTRGERLDNIVMLLAEAAEPLSHKEIAERLGLKVTPYTLELLRTLVRDGNAQHETEAGSYPPRYLYTVTASGRDLSETIRREREAIPFPRAEDPVICAMCGKDYNVVERETGAYYCSQCWQVWNS